MNAQDMNMQLIRDNVLHWANCNYTKLQTVFTILNAVRLEDISGEEKPHIESLGELCEQLIDYGLETYIDMYGDEYEDMRHPQIKIIVVRAKREKILADKINTVPEKPADYVDAFSYMKVFYLGENDERAVLQFLEEKMGISAEMIAQQYTWSQHAVREPATPVAEK